MPLLDTCTFVWLVSQPNSLSSAARRAIEAEPARLFLSSISAFEIAVKYRQGKLRLSHPPKEWVARGLKTSGVAEIPVDIEIGVTSAELPLIHKDPCDRIIIATAQ